MYGDNVKRLYPLLTMDIIKMEEMLTTKTPAEINSLSRKLDRELKRSSQTDKDTYGLENIHYVFSVCIKYHEVIRLRKRGS